MNSCLYGGVDPSGSASRPTGVAILDDRLQVVVAESRFDDAEVIAFFAEHGDRLFAVGLDGPCALPIGLQECCFQNREPTCGHEQPAGRKGRLCERELARRGIGCFFTVKKSFAKSWVLRSIGLYRQLREAGLMVHEVYPYASKRLLFGRQMVAKQTRVGRAFLASALAELGIVLPQKQLSHHELDAIVGAYTVYLLAHGRAERVGDEQEGYIVIPAGEARP
ncbi:MAG: DUF429 domain-containing protein [Calditrichaeota bacterium]|nr:DUF429 domain-containing protein [Calditrichota bacterium]